VAHQLRDQQRVCLVSGTALNGSTAPLSSPGWTSPLVGSFGSDGVTLTISDPSGNWSVVKQPDISIRMTPATTQIRKPGDSISFTPQIAGSANKAVTWSATAGTFVNGSY